MIMNWYSVVSVVWSRITALKQRTERDVILQFDSTELKQRSERGVISQFNSSELK